MTKRSIDRLRDAALSMTIGDESDESPISEMISMDGRMCIVKQRGIWEAQLADNVDPDRTNPQIPNIQQKVIARGSDDALVGRTLLQAKRLLKPAMLPREVRVDEALVLTLKFLIELDGLQGKAESFEEKTRTLNEAVARAQPSGGTYQVPAVGDVAARGKSFIQAADHTVRILWDLIRIFYLDLPVGVSWRKLRERLRTSGEETQPFAQALEELERGFKFLRNTRNAIEHPKPGQQVIFNDYRLKPDGKVHVPTIEVIEKDTALPETDLGAYFEGTLEFMLGAYEALLVHACGLHVRALSALPVELVELPVEMRRYPHVKYGYATMMGEQLVPYLD